VVRTLPAFLPAGQVPAVLAQLDGQERQVVATAVYTGMRKGEIGGPRKEDVHLDAAEIWLQRCWDGPTTKDGKPSVIPIHPDLRQYLEDAIAASPSRLVFPRPDGSMHRRDVGWDDALRRALAAAGVVEGYEHGCRAHRCGWRERTAKQRAPETCPRCAKPSTWSKPLPRHLTFKDLRHTTATLLLKAGVPLATVQRLLRHSDPKLTSMIYGHLETDDLRRGLERLQLGAPAPKPTAGPEAPALALVVNSSASRTAPELRNVSKSEDEGPAVSGNPEHRRGLQMVGATGFEPATTCTPSAVTGRAGSVPTSQGLGKTRGDVPRGTGVSPGFAGDRRSFAASLLLALGDADCLLTVADVARRLRVSRATVYKLVAEGKLPHVRIGNSIRFLTGKGLHKTKPKV
jgi:excisionase family DNA binding protein